MSTKHLMLDLETMSLRADAAIVQIGAVAFGPEHGYIGQRFNRYVKLEEGSGRLDPDTVLWWLGQDESAQRAFREGQGKAVALAKALLEFSTFCAAEQPAAIWAHGASFDIPVLASAYDRVGRQAPWGYRDARDTRTLFALAGCGLDAVQRVGTAHNAADDAETQALAVIEAVKRLKAKSEVPA